MSLAVRVIPCLDVDAGRVVKGVHFENLKDAGDPVELAAEYYRQGADEITFLDVTASSSHRNTMIDVVSCTAEQVFIPMTVGGGVRTPEDVDSLLRCGADKVGVNTAAINDPSLISRVADRFGNQVLVLSVDARREKGEQHTQSGFEVTTMGGRKSTGIDAIWWVKRAEQLGAGEILLNSMDADGTKEGFDLEMIRAVRKEVKIPIIASGGAGKVEDFPPAIEAGADAVLAASVFHYGVRTPEDVDSLLRCGADKVGVNTAAINDPSLISRVADRFGNQVLVLSVDARREKGEQHTQSGFEVTTMGGRKSTGIDAIWWVKRAEQLGAGEILLNSMDADGTKEGFDLEMIRAVRKEVKIPIIASGGAGKVEDFPPAIEAGADAVLAASVFHYGILTIADVKAELKKHGYTVR